MPRKSIAEIRREEIIEAFYKVVSEKGFAGATVREIAHTIGCSYRMLHHYFSDKDEVIRSFVDFVSNRYIGELRERTSNGMNAADRLVFINDYLSDSNRFTLEFCRAWVGCWALSNSNSAVSDALNECYNDAREIIADIIRAGIRSGEFREVDPIITANLLLATSEGVTMLWVVNTKSIPIKRVNEHIPEFWLSYLRNHGEKS